MLMLSTRFQVSVSNYTATSKTALNFRAECFKQLARGQSRTCNVGEDTGTHMLSLEHLRWKGSWAGKGYKLPRNIHS